MHAVTLSWEQLALLAFTYALVGAVGVFVGALLSGRPKRQSGSQAAREQAALADEVRSIRQELQALAGKQITEKPVVAEKVESAYSQAIRLAQQGLDSAAVAAGCGISRGEADLIVAIYRASQRP
ncbi:DUF2802 domain-containing protein [Chitinimonas sp.]|uniref:DUF2802 domain-containing protein n=1 Tax=Chitinimonas sp. TaxID=1934313 RepID=UPI0035ADCA11